MAYVETAMVTDEMILQMLMCIQNTQQWRAQIQGSSLVNLNLKPVLISFLIIEENNRNGSIDIVKK